MVKLIVAIKRKEGMGIKDFHDHWRNVHANLIKTTPVCRKYIRKYVQCHTLPQEYQVQDGCFDGVAEVWFDTPADKDSFFTHPEYLAMIRPDEMKFADLGNCRFFMTQEEHILP